MLPRQLRLHTLRLSALPFFRSLLVRVHDQKGEGAAAELVAKLGSNAESARDLAYRLFRICEQKDRTQEALGYNALVRSWGEISELANRTVVERQATLFDRG